MNEPSTDHGTALAQLGALLERRRFADTRDLLSKVLPKYPGSASLLQYAAWVDWMEDRLDESLATVRRILEIEPESFDARLLLTRIRMEQERFAEAEAAVIDLLKDFPEEPGLYAVYARIMLQTFNIAKAEQLAGEALRRDPEHEDALNVHVLCGFISSPGGEQRERLRNLLQEHPDQLGTTVRLIQALVDDGKTGEAYQLARELVRVYPDNQDIVEMATSLRHSSHWSLLPLWPMRKWGWAGSIGIWFGVLVLLRSDLLVGTPFAAYQNAIALVFIGYVVYSWIWPPMLKRILG